MAGVPDKLARRAEAKAGKREEKRRALMESASGALRALGYANTSLRDIAEASGVSLGQLHYYFEDRTDLILFCVHHYKDAFLADVAAATDGVRDRDGAVSALAGVLAATLAQSALTHRLWYDIRAQAMFDPAFRPVVAEIEAAMIAVFAELEARMGAGEAGREPPAGARAEPSAEAPAGTRPGTSAALDYAAVDGLFRWLMQQDPRPPEAEMRAAFADLLSRLWPPGPTFGPGAGP